MISVIKIKTMRYLLREKRKGSWPIGSFKPHLSNADWSTRIPLHRQQVSSRRIIKRQISTQIEVTTFTYLSLIVKLSLGSPQFREACVEGVGYCNLPFCVRIHNSPDRDSVRTLDENLTNIHLQQQIKW